MLPHSLVLEPASRGPDGHVLFWSLPERFRSRKRGQQRGKNGNGVIRQAQSSWQRAPPVIIRLACNAWGVHPAARGSGVWDTGASWPFLGRRTVGSVQRNFLKKRSLASTKKKPTLACYKSPKKVRLARGNRYRGSLMIPPGAPRPGHSHSGFDVIIAVTRPPAMALMASLNHLS